MFKRLFRWLFELFLNDEKRYFRRKLRGVQSMIWDDEFKRYKTSEIKEEIRVQYDSMRSKLLTLDEQIKSEKEHSTMDKGDAARLDDQKVLLDRDIEKLLNQMKEFDLEISGSNPNSDYPQGVSGINQKLDALRELQVMLTDYIKIL